MKAVQRSCGCSRQSAGAGVHLAPPHPCSLPPPLAAQAHLTRGTDRELLYLSAYLTKIAALDSLEGLNHK